MGQQGTYGAVWNEIGSRPGVVRDDRHDTVWLFGSVCPQRAVDTASVMPWVGGQAMSLHLDAVSKNHLFRSERILGADFAFSGSSSAWSLRNGEAVTSWDHRCKRRRRLGARRARACCAGP